MKNKYSWDFQHHPFLREMIEFLCMSRDRHSYSWLAPRGHQAPKPGGQMQKGSGRINHQGHSHHTRSKVTSGTEQHSVVGVCPSQDSMTLSLSPLPSQNRRGLREDRTIRGTALRSHGRQREPGQGSVFDWPKECPKTGDCRGSERGRGTGSDPDDFKSRNAMEAEESL